MTWCNVLWLPVTMYLIHESLFQTLRKDRTFCTSYVYLYFATLAYPQVANGTNNVVTDTS